MMPKHTLLFSLLLTASFSLGLPGCVTFDQVAYNNATSLKLDLPELMEKAVESFSKYTKEVDNIRQRLDEAELHSGSQRRNQDVTAAWSQVKSLANPFFDEWKKKGQLTQVYAKERADQVRKSLEFIAEAERAKRRKGISGVPQPGDM